MAVNLRRRPVGDTIRNGNASFDATHWHVGLCRRLSIWFSYLIWRSPLTLLGIWLLVSAFDLPALADPESPSLEILSTAAEARTQEFVLIMVTRRGSVAHAPVKLQLEAPAIIMEAGSNGRCARAGFGAPSLVWPAGQSDSGLFCLYAANRVKTRVLAFATGADGVVKSAQSEAIQFTSQSLGTNPVYMALLTAAVGFVFGLGSSWFSAFTEAYRNRKKAMVETQEFITKTYFPEIQKHAQFIARYFAAASAERQILAVSPLALPAAALAYSEEKFAALTRYFASIKRKPLQEGLREYAQLTQRFNDQANLLLSEQPGLRNTKVQESIAEVLRRALIEMGYL